MRLSLYLARQATAKGDHSEALFHYFVVLKTVTEKTRHEDFAAEFAEALAQQLTTCDDANFAHNIWANSLALFETSPLVHEIVARDAFQRGEVVEAIDRFETCIKLTQGNERVAHRMNLANFKSQLFDAWHFPMINDVKRNRKFAEALVTAVTPMDSVFEIGAGTGLLSLVAGKITNKVTSCEYNPIMARVAKQVVEKNHLMDRVEIVQESSFEIEMPIKANVIVSETMDCCVFGEGTVGAILDAHQRVAAAGALFIPQQTSVYIALLSSASIHSNHVGQVGENTVCSPYVNMEGQGFLHSDDRDPYWCGYLNDFSDAKIQSDWVEVISVNFTRPEELSFLVDEGAEGRLTLKAKSKTLVHALVASFSANLYGNASIDTKGDSCWPNGIYPLRKALNLDEGETVDIRWTLSGGATRLEIKLDEDTNEKDDLPVPMFVVSENSEVLLLNNLGIQDYLLSSIPSNATRIHDLTSIASFCLKLKAIRPNVELSICQPEENLLLLISSQLSADVMVAPLPGQQDVIVHWPLRTDGTLNKMALDWVATGYAPMAEVVPSIVIAVGQLVSSTWLHQRTRPYPASHLGFDLSPLSPFSLFEYRDISLTNFPHTAISEPFEFMPIAMNGNLDMSVPKEPMLFNRTLTTRVTTTCSGECDGVFYWWRVGEYDSKMADDRLAAFIFPQRIQLEEGDVLEIRADFYKGDLLVEATKVGSSL
ncbi:unnamed protein product, partial [Mesorhabditis belari]|uniref:Uncharacterized protein n=1 Tax=Mesorhabditis belari TaxID=2138241 RepID=A0AAF3FBL7_9BILA